MPISGAKGAVHGDYQHSLMAKIWLDYDFFDRKFGFDSFLNLRGVVTPASCACPLLRRLYPGMSGHESTLENAVTAHKRAGDYDTAVILQ